MSKKTMLIVAVSVLVVGAGVFLYMRNQKALGAKSTGGKINDTPATGGKTNDTSDTTDNPIEKTGLANPNATKEGAESKTTEILK